MTESAINQVQLPSGYFDGIMSMIRVKLGAEVIRPHVKECLKEYIACLFLDERVRIEVEQLLKPQAGKASASACGKLKARLRECPWIKHWFDIKEFWKLHKDNKNPEDCLIDLITALHGCWIFLLDDARNTFAFPIFDDRDREYVPVYFGQGVNYKKGLKKELHNALGRDYTLRPGQGSVGLGLRADASVCLRDTVRDVRGSVALEDCLMRNLSYIGIPVHSLAALGKKEERKDKAYYERRIMSRPNGHFGLFFPAIGAWHKDMQEHEDFRRCCHGRGGCSGDRESKACGQVESPGACLHREVEKFAEQAITPIVEELYRQIQLQTFQIKSTAIAELGDNQEFTNVNQDQHARIARRRLFLEKLVRPADARGRAFGDFLAIEGAQLWERKNFDEVTGDTEEWICQSIWRGGETFLSQLSSDSEGLFSEQSCSGKSINEFIWSDCAEPGPKPPHSWRILAEAIPARNNVFQSISFGSGSKVRLIVVNFGSHEISQELEKALNDFWHEVEALAEFPNQAIDWSRHPEYLDKVETKNNNLNRFSRRIREVKWRLLVYSHAARLLARAIVGTGAKKKARLSPSKYIVVDGARNQKWMTSLAAIASTAQKHFWKVDAVWIHRLWPWEKSISWHNSSHVFGDEDRKRLELEVNSPATLRVLETVAECWADTVSQFDLPLPASLTIKSIPERGCQSSDAWGHKLLQSDWVPAEGGMIDCGTLTAIGIPALWSLWTASRLDASSIEQIDVVARERGKINEVDICLRTNMQQEAMKVTFTKTQEGCGGKRPRNSLLASEIAEYPVLDNLHMPYRSAFMMAIDTVQVDSESQQLVGEFMARLDTRCSDHLPKNKEGKPDGNISPLIARVGEDWKRKRCNFGEESCPLSKSLSKAMKDAGYCDMFDQQGSIAVAHRLLSMAYSRRGLCGNGEHSSDALGLRTHSLMPLYGPGDNKTCLGVLVLSGSQQENDSIDRVSIRQDQQALLKFAADYLEYALNQEIMSLQRVESVAKAWADASHDLKNMVSMLNPEILVSRVLLLSDKQDARKLNEFKNADNQYKEISGYLDTLDGVFRNIPESPSECDDSIHAISELWRVRVCRSRSIYQACAHWFAQVPDSHDFQVVEVVDINGERQAKESIKPFCLRIILSELLTNALKYCDAKFAIDPRQCKQVYGVRLRLTRDPKGITVQVVNGISECLYDLVDGIVVIKRDNRTMLNRLNEIRPYLVGPDATVANLSSGRGLAFIEKVLRINYPKATRHIDNIYHNGIAVHRWSCFIPHSQA